MSVPTIDEQAWSSLEPGTAHPLQRLRAVKQLCAAGVRAGVLMAPVVPGFTSRQDQLEATVRAIADHGAAFIGVNLMYLKGGTRDHFLGFIQKEFPHMLEGFEKLYRGAYAPAPYVSSVRAMVSALQKRYDVGLRGERYAERVERVERVEHEGKPEEEKAALEQAAFDW